MNRTVTSEAHTNNRLFPRLLALLLTVVAAALPAIGHAAPPTLVAYINLRNSATVPPTFIPVGPAVTTIPGAALALSPHASNDGTFFMTAVKVNLTGFTRACFTLDYEGTPVGWTLNVGDDSTNDGFGGGGPGLSSSVAELQILEEVLAMFSIALGPGLVDQLATQQLSLLNGSFKVCVGDDVVTWGNPAGGVTTTNSKIGFQIPDSAPATGFSPAGNGNREIFAGFNRVVNGSSRNGVGLARVLITLQ
jgi:hypothetical protein